MPDVHRLRRGARQPTSVFLLLAGGATATLLMASLLALLLVGSPQAPWEEGVYVFYNEACGDCAPYLDGVLLPALRAAGYEEVTVKDYLQVRAHREELTALNDAFDVALDLRAHLAAFVVHDTALLLQGHIPEPLLGEALALHREGTPGVLLVYQDSMGIPTSYRAWAPPAQPGEFPLTTPLAVYAGGDAGRRENGGTVSFAVLVLGAGLLDGLNPCAIAILLFFLSFLYVARRPRGEVLRMGALYVYAVYLVYFLIGLGFLGAAVLTGASHLLARVGAYLLVALGLLTLGGLGWRPLGAFTRTPHALWERTKPRLLRATLPAAFAAGILVGLCTFPCSGGVYVAILGLLSVRASYASALGYLALYNLMFVLPLVALLAAVSNRSLARRLALGHAAHEKRIRALSALLMVGVGAVLLLFFV